MDNPEVSSLRESGGFTVKRVGDDEGVSRVASGQLPSNQFRFSQVPWGDTGILSADEPLVKGKNKFHEDKTEKRRSLEEKKREAAAVRKAIKEVRAITARERRVRESQEAETAGEERHNSSQPVSEQLLDPQTGTSENKSYNVRLISKGMFRESNEAAEIFLNEDKLVVKSKGGDVATMNYTDIKSFGPSKDTDKRNPSTIRIDSKDGSKIKIGFYEDEGLYPDYYNFKADLENKTGIRRHGGGRKSKRRKYTKRRKSKRRKYTKRRKSKKKRGNKTKSRKSTKRK